MPLYDFFCEKCLIEFEDFKSVEKREVSLCPECGEVSKKILSIPSFKILHTGDQDCKGIMNIAGRPMLVRGKDHFNRLCKQNNVFTGSDKEGKQHAAFKRKINEESNKLRIRREAKSLAEQMHKDGVIGSARKALIEDNVLVKGYMKGG